MSDTVNETSASKRREFERIKLELFQKGFAALRDTSSGFKDLAATNRLYAEWLTRTRPLEEESSSSSDTEHQITQLQKGLAAHKEIARADLLYAQAVVGLRPLEEESPSSSDTEQQENVSSEHTCAS
ncbi:uncharacterized protein SPPG_09371 [Spizellomyces punctatus DAOM BR117]|uniref:Uncharacterized protein n=1 Tax=Spizellomyces punctatus (strain DAOM BR117) TaxID=645134 RepID=A0A0L0H8Z3_SPIPD|nr:uncharacterized protein SPPG_09371 [Spizellomyces punctatus DAOM BR117]KNC98005.1 hypothetical protein SPPG_09371 [Spizellomyces punctatus DAOM BR117]|eukprot:XP_016606045.1 hypothetical protein SPPG_09371 [Spizellomyces punctatus DAOM BR117]